jgi:adenosylcobinamide-phosphate synthase
MSLPSTAPDALGLGLGYVADLLLGDPRRAHPVAGFGRLAGRLEQRLYADGRPAGATTVLILVGGVALVGLAGARATRRSPLARTVLVALGTWAVLGGRSLRREAVIISGQLADEDLPAARRQIRHLVGRDPTLLQADGLSRACVESVAENTSDAVVAPLCWGAALGLPGLLAYRAVNTLDAMFGHRSPRYARFGWAAARLDDAANWLPARLTAGLVATVAPLVGGSPAAALQAAREDAPAHPSPNAGVVEAAFAGALGIRLGGRNVYEGMVEDRGELGDGRPAAPTDITRAVRLSALASAASALLAVTVSGLLGRRR